MSTIPNRSSVSLLALCCAALASGVVAFDPPPAGFPTPPSRRQSAELIPAAMAADAESALDIPLTESSLLPQ